MRTFDRPTTGSNLSEDFSFEIIESGAEFGVEFGVEIGVEFGEIGGESS